MNKEILEGFKKGEIGITFSSRDQNMIFLKICEEENITWGMGRKATSFIPGEHTYEYATYIVVTDDGHMAYGTGIYSNPEKTIKSRNPKIKEIKTFEQFIAGKIIPFEEVLGFDE